MCVTSKLCSMCSKKQANDCNHALHTLSDHNISTRNNPNSTNYYYVLSCFKNLLKSIQSQQQTFQLLLENNYELFSLIGRYTKARYLAETALGAFESLQQMC